MRYLELADAADAAGTDAVTGIWYLDMPRSHPVELVLPLPSTEIIVNLSDPYEMLPEGGEPYPAPAVFLTGVRDRAVRFGNPPRLRHIGVRFALDGPALLGLVPGSEVTAVPDDLARALLGAVPERFRTGSAPEPPEQGEPGEQGERGMPGEPEDAEVLEWLRAIARAIAGRLEAERTAERAAHRTVRAALGRWDADPARPIGEVAAELGIAHKTLIARFRAVTGVAPSRIVRTLMVHRLLGTLPPAGEPWTWTELVARSPYVDQSHFIRSFKRVTGLTPKRYLAALAASTYDTPYFIGGDISEDIGRDVGSGARHG